MKLGLLISLLIPLLLTACSGDPKDTATTKQPQPSAPATKQATDRISGKTAIEAHKRAKAALNDVEKVQQDRARQLDEFKQD